MTTMGNGNAPEQAVDQQQVVILRFQQARKTIS